MAQRYDALVVSVSLEAHSSSEDTSGAASAELGHDGFLCDGRDASPLHGF